MTLRVEQYEDVVRLRMSSRGSRLAGLDVSAYLVRGTLIDSGFHRARGELANALETFGVRDVILTHWHEDHAGNAELIAARGLPMSIHPDTETILRRRPPIRPYRRVVWGHPPPLRSPVVLREPRGLVIIPTPGHTDDHRVVWDPSTRTLFSGDVWLGVRAKVMHDTEDPFAIVASLKAIAALEPRRMFDAHRGLIADPVAALVARAEWLTEITGEIARRVAQGWSDREIVRHVLGGEERAAFASAGEYSRRNLVRAVKRRVPS